MIYVNSGNGRVPLISLIAVLTISITVNLPGLAISPIMDELKNLFKNASELDLQWLTIIPNLVVIPFMLCAGKIANSRNQVVVLGVGLAIYVLSGILYLFATTLLQLILISILLGIGSGLVIPLAASFIAQLSTGNVRTRMLGWESGLSNFTVICATVFVGWMATFEWHMCFIVYLVPIIPLALIPFMTKSFIDKHKITSNVGNVAIPESEKFRPDYVGKKSIMMLLGLIALYIVMTYGTVVVAYFMPFTMKYYKFSSTAVGVATAAYFLGISITGFLLTYIISILKQYTLHVAIFTCAVGLFMIGIFHTLPVYFVGILLIGLGYGVLQPIIFDKTTYLAPNEDKSTAYFAYVLTGNYVALAIVPFVVKLGSIIFDDKSTNFAYLLNTGILLLLLIIAVINRRSFVFRINPSLYKK